MIRKKKKESIKCVDRIVNRLTKISSPRAAQHDRPRGTASSTSEQRNPRTERMNTESSVRTNARTYLNAVESRVAREGGLEPGPHGGEVDRRAEAEDGHDVAVEVRFPEQPPRRAHRLRLLVLPRRVNLLALAVLHRRVRARRVYRPLPQRAAAPGIHASGFRSVPGRARAFFLSRGCRTRGMGRSSTSHARTGPWWSWRGSARVSTSRSAARARLSELGAGACKTVWPDCLSCRSVVGGVASCDQAAHVVGPREVNKSSIPPVEYGTIIQRCASPPIVGPTRGWLRWL